MLPANFDHGDNFQSDTDSIRGLAGGNVANLLCEDPRAPWASELQN